MLSHLDIFPARISVPYAESNLHVGRLLLLDKVEGTPVIPNSTHIMLKKYNGHLGNSSDGRYLFLEKYQYFLFDKISAYVLSVLHMRIGRPYSQSTSF